MVRFEVTWSLTIFHGAHFPRDDRSPVRLHSIAGLVSVERSFLVMRYRESYHAKSCTVEVEVMIEVSQRCTMRNSLWIFCRILRTTGGSFPE